MIISIAIYVLLFLMIIENCFLFDFVFVQLQYVNGGPIIAFQIENEYGSFPYGTFESRSHYMEQIQMVNGFNTF